MINKERPSVNQGQPEQTLREASPRPINSVAFDLAAGVDWDWMKRNPNLPFTFLNVAMTADGKIAPASRQFVPFGSARDHTLLLNLRATADAVMSGAGTVNSFPMDLGPGGRKYQQRRIRNGLSEYNLRVVVSGSGSINPGAKVFQRPFSPVIVLTTERAPKHVLKKLQDVGAEVHLSGTKEIDFRRALAWLKERWKVQRLLCEGGGELNDALLREDLVHRVHVTICPFIFGGRNAPTLADGEGVSRLADAKRLELKGMKRLANELFLTYDVLSPQEVKV